TGTYAGAGAGQVRINGATLAASGSATLNFSSGGMAFLRGEILGPGTFTLQGPFVVATGSTKYIRDCVTINNQGTFRMDGATIYGGNASIFNNSGTFELAGQAEYRGNAD